jgi:hypothetical protein
MMAWRQKAEELIAARDMRETLHGSRQNADQIMTDLRRRACTSIATQPGPQLATRERQPAN